MSRSRPARTSHVSVAQRSTPRKTLLLALLVAVGWLLWSPAAHAQVPPNGWPGELSVQVEPGAPGGSGGVTPIDVSHLRAERTHGGWRVNVPGGRPLATPAVSGGLVFVGGGFGSTEFYAFDAQTGDPRWGIRVSDDGPTGAVVSDGYVAFNTESCTLFIVRAEDGSPVWSRWLGDPLMSQPAIADGRVFMVYPSAASHLLAAFDLATGEPLWSAPVDTDAITAPVVVNGEVYVTAMAGNVYRFSAATGERRWVRSERATSAPWVDGERIFVSMHDETDDGAAQPVEGLGYLAAADGRRQQALGEAWGRREAPWLSREIQARTAYQADQDENDGSVGFGGGAPAMARTEAAGENIGMTTVHGLWEFQGSRPLLIGDRVLATVGEMVQATRAGDGETLWQRELEGDTASLGGHLGTPPALAAGHAFVGTTSGQLLALSPESGEVAWSHDVGLPLRTQPAVVGGRVYVGATDGTLLMVDSGLRGPGDWPMWGGSAAHQLVANPSL